MTGAVRVGVSGWTYPSWRAHLYRGIPARAWLQRVAEVFDSVEINGSFYTQIAPATYQRWYEQTPAGFRFALKGHRFVTHYKQLRGVTESIARLRAQAAPLADKLGAVLWQLPSRAAADLPKLRDFLAELRAWPGVDHVLELRHRSWFTDEVAAALAEAGAASCISDAPTFPLWMAVTGPLVYVRLHGHTRLYASSYKRPALERWADEIERWVGEGRRVEVYFDNDAEGAAVGDGLVLEDLLAARGLRAPRTVAVEHPRVMRGAGRAARPGTGAGTGSGAAAGRPRAPASWSASRSS
ncbi:MAG TPA: DUF72 domain-containing protein [Kofleriaceae bacterium]|nr:DUF72 domain-containing protein [Kofleriaceae bacterium]